MRKKIMITGVAGLIGSHLAEKLISLDHEVYGFDIVDIESDRNLDNIKNHENFIYFKGDVRSSEDLSLFFQTDATVLYHLASVVGVNRYMEDPLSLIDIGILGTRTLISMCHKNGIRMLFASTSEIYGKNSNIPWQENDDRILGPTDIDRWSYSSSKALCEHMLFGMHHKDNWPMSIVRFFNVYGPRQNPIYVVSKSVHRVLNGIAPELYDGGQQTRCFTYIDDVIDGLILAATLDSAIGNAINIGNTVENTMSEVVNAVLQSSDSNLEITHVKTEERYGNVYEDIPRRVPTIDKAFNLLGWKPVTSMQAGVKKTVNWAKKNDWYLK
ncbi:GDP-mannose 4,6-dehydratase [Candidatus Pelagibacter sp.]|nr:GDP-mannose 4,6-dehydratase [Candidatus Pelagibacter sp.]|tara:strand:- start:467 stop:1447 length:981 start_codon:yes stop_codon:yes gene_type:complete